MPAIFATYVFISYSFFTTEIEKTIIIEKINLGEELYFGLFNVLGLIHLLTYLIWANQLRTKYIREAASFFSNIQTTKLDWLKQFIYLVSVLVILILLSYIGAYSINPEYAILSDLIATPFFTFFVYLFILISAQHNNVLFSKESYTSHSVQLEPFNSFIQENFNSGKNKKPTQPLKDEFCDDIENTLIQLMTIDKVYLDNSLNISKLATLVGITSHQLSYFINFKYQKNFYEFVSIYRVEEAKQRLTNSQYENYKIEVIGEESGFNSRSTFFTTFKKHTGQSPLSYRKSALL
ncbi:MAG: AraC family transcriptional regulator [Cytophagaceae bacterium]